jgi:hypothetical protein
VVGYTSTPTDFGGGMPTHHVGRSDTVLITLDADGQYQNVQSLGSVGLEEVQRVAAGGDGAVYVSFHTWRSFTFDDQEFPARGNRDIMLFKVTS